MINLLALLGILLATVSVARLRGAGTSPSATAALCALLAFSVASESQWADQLPLTTGRIIVVIGIVAAAIVAVSGRAATAAGSPDEAGQQLPHALIWVVVLAVYIAAVNIVASVDASFVQVLGRLLPVLAWIGIAQLVASRVLNIQVLALGVGLTLGLCLAAAPLAPSPWTECSEFKCSAVGQLFRGTFESENSLARLACIAAVSSFAVRGRWFRGLVLCIAALVLVATESRTSQAALLASLLVVLIGRAAGQGGQRVLRLVAAVGVAFGLILGIVLLVTAEPHQFSNRGTIWRWGMGAVEKAWVFGSGIDNWTIRVLARNYMHSESLYLLYAGGIVATVLYFACLISAARNALGEQQGVKLGLLCLLVTSGILEVVFNPAAIDGTAPFVVMLLVVAGVERRHPGDLGSRRGAIDRPVRLGLK